MSCTHGANCRLALNAKDYGFCKFIPHGVVKQIVDGSVDAIRGYMELSANRRTDGPLLANFSVLIEPTWEEMTLLIADILGFDDTSGNDAEIAEDATAHDVLVDYDFSVTKFSDAKCGGFEWSGQKGTSPCKLMMHFFAKNWQVDQIWSATAIDEDVPYSFQIGTLNLPGGTGVSFDRFKLSVDRHMFVEHNNSATPTDICPRYTEVLFATNTPHTNDDKAILHRWLTSSAGADGVLTHTFAGRSTVWNIGYLQAIAQGVPIPGKENIRKGMFYRAGKYVNPSTLAVTPSLAVIHTVP